MKAWSVRKRCSGSCLRGRRNSCPFVSCIAKAAVRAGGRREDRRCGRTNRRTTPWVDVVETAGRDDGEHDGGATLGTGKGPVSTPECNTGAGKTWGSRFKIKLCLFETAVRNGCSDLKNPMSGNRRPTHLTLVHAGIDEAVGSTFRR